MESILTPSNITFTLGILAIMFSVYNYFRNPQIKSEKTDALLQQRMQWTSESNEKRFCGIQENINKAFELAFNHSNEALVGVKELTTVVNAMGKEITRLSTIIEERIPKK